MQIGLVGKPSSGKSTFFSAATLVDVAIANYPFTTIEPNTGIGFVRVDCVDREFRVQCNPRTGYCVNHVRYVPVELIDVAGLVPGASEGKGRGNQFLSDLAQADCLIHVVDASGSTNSEGEVCTPGSHDPLVDIEFFERELDAWYVQVIQRNWRRFNRTPFTSQTEKISALAQNLSGIGAREHTIEKALLNSNLTEIRLEKWSEDDQKKFGHELRLLAKPIVVAANKMDVPAAAKNLERLKGKLGENAIGCSAIAELTLKKAAKEGFIEYYPGQNAFVRKKELADNQAKGMEYIQAHVLATMGGTGVQAVLEKTVFDILRYIAIFPAGTKKLEDSQGRVLRDCLLLPPGSTALDFAFKLHTDMGKGFIRAIDVKTHQMIGKDHPLKSRDAVEIVFRAP